MRELDFRMLESMHLKVGRVSRAYGAYICETQDGIKLVKEMQYPLADVMFAYQMKEYLLSQGFTATDRYCVTDEGLPYIQDGAIQYTVRNWIRGDEPDLMNPKHVDMMIRTLAQMHLYGCGMEEPEGYESKQRWYDLSEKLSKQSRMIRGYCRNIKRKRRYTDFDLLFLKIYRYYEKQVVQASEMMQDTVCMQEAERARLIRSLIHGEYTDHAAVTDHRNILLCNFEKSCYGMPVQDLILFLEKLMRKWNWDFTRCLRVLDVYQQQRPLSGYELRILYAGLLFPERFARMCQDAYGTKRRWISQSNWSKLLEIREMQGKREEFLLDFRRYFQI